MAEKKSDQWEIVATVREPAAVVIPWVAWHLEQGAAQVHVFFDDPLDPVADLLEGAPQVRVTRCDKAYWQRLGGRPRRHQVRQSRNATHAYASCQSDWILHCDADEFLYPQQPMGRLLAGWGPHIGALRVPNIERYWPQEMPQKTLFDGRFRRPFKGSMGEGRARFGPDFDLTSGGLTAHGMGKSFCRTGRDYHVKIHSPQLPTGARPMYKVARSAVLLHFDGVTPLHWILKLMDRAAGAAEGGSHGLLAYRVAQVRAIRSSRSLSDLMALHHRLKRPSPAIEAEMEALGLTETLDFKPEAPVTKWFPDLRIDLSPERLDKALRAGATDVLERFRVSSVQA